MTAINTIHTYHYEEDHSGKGNRVWFGETIDIANTVVIQGDSLEEIQNACFEAIRRWPMLPANTEFDLIPILDELDDFGGTEGDVQLCTRVPFDTSTMEACPF